MIIKKGRTLFFDKAPCIKSFASAVGRKEANGPLKDYFDIICNDIKIGQKTFEKAEAKLQNLAVCRAISKAKKETRDIDYILGGDLLNQCIGSSYGLRPLGVPFLGLYGACSTMAEAIGMSSVLCASGAANLCAAVSSSHFCSAERQFRFPIHYGGQRAPTNQWTVTGAGSVVISSEQNKKLPQIKAVTFGRIEDLGVCDINNMGAAMAPAAASTISAFFEDSKRNPNEFDLILTGDLGMLGSDLLVRLLMDNGIDIKDRQNDCGKLIYSNEKQDTHCGGSGSGCCASVLCSKILRELEEGKLKEILFVATGALMSTISVQQGESIPAVAHLIDISCGEG